MNDELTMDRFVKHADFWNSNIDSGFDSLTNLLPPKVRSMIQQTLIQFVNNSKGAYGTPDLTRFLSGTSEILRVTQAYVNSEYATQVADTSWSEAAEYMAPVSRTMAQNQASVVSIEAIFALLDCSTLRQTMQDVNQLLCTDTLDQIKDIYELGVKIIVFLALVIFALMVHGLVMDNPPRHYLCPNQNCGRWFRFKMSLNAHLKVGCNQGSCAVVFCQRTSSSAFYACLLFFICIPQGLLIFSLQQQDAKVDFSVTELNLQGKGAAVMMSTGILGLFGVMFPLRNCSSWLPLTCCLTGLVYAGYAFGQGTSDYYDQVDACDGLTGMFRNLMATLATNPLQCTMAKRTESLKWTLYDALSKIVSGMGVLTILWLFIVRNEVAWLGLACFAVASVALPCFGTSAETECCWC